MDNAHPSRPESDPASPLPASVSRGDEGLSVDVSELPPNHRDILRTLSHRVTQAVQQIEQLREENERLRERVEELEAKPAYPEEESVIAIDNDPEVLRERINNFIDVIDTYLESSPSESSPPPVEGETDA